jgi:hypothetical protein
MFGGGGIYLSNIGTRIYEQNSHILIHRFVTLLLLLLLL